MEPAESGLQRVSIRAERVGGIERTEVTFDPGVTILVGRNATHRTSLLQAIMAGLGSRHASLKGDADAGRVSLSIGGEEYDRTLSRQDGGVAFGGDPYLDDPTLADLFAFLLESNEARRTVAVGGDLCEIVMEPVDSASIEADIERLEGDKRELTERIEDCESLRAELPDLEAERTRLDGEVERTRERLADARERLDDQSAGAPESGEGQSELEAKMAALQEARSSLERTEFRLDSQRDSLETLRDRVEELTARKADLADTTADGESIAAEIGRLQDRKSALASELTSLQSVIQFNEEMLEGTSQDIAAALREAETGEEAVMDQLVEEEVVCWTCGTRVEPGNIEATLARLRELRESKYAEQSDVEARLAELKDRQSDIESRRCERERLTTQIQEARAEIDEREVTVDELEAEKRAHESEIETLEDEIEQLERPDRSTVIDAHKRVNELEVELERLEDERDRVASNIEQLRDRTADIETLRERMTAIDTELAERRTRIERIEREAVEGFNGHMDTVLEMLAYDNIERIWIERTDTGGEDAASAFELHVVRSTDDGVTYEDDFDHLSESEREVTGLVFALAGYLAHDVYETVPFILLDSLEAIDSGRIADLVAYVQEYAEYLVVALLPEDAAALDDSYQRVTDI